MQLPLREIKDGYVFQQLIAEYFRSLRGERNAYHLADIDVEDNGVGADGGVDMIVDFHYLDVISKHSFRWIIECKCWNENIGLKDIDTNNLLTLLNAKKAHGYLLVCKGKVTTSLKNRFRELSQSGTSGLKFEIWEGARLWHKISERENLIKAFFPKYYGANFIDNKGKELYEKLVKKYEQERLKKMGK